jgi:hypothetical protein
MAQNEPTDRAHVHASCTVEYAKRTHRTLRGFYELPRPPKPRVALPENATIFGGFRTPARVDFHGHFSYNSPSFNPPLLVHGCTPSYGRF